MALSVEHQRRLRTIHYEIAQVLSEIGGEPGQVVRTERLLKAARFVDQAIPEGRRS